MLDDEDFEREQGTESSLLASVKEQEAQFKRLTMELEHEQRHIPSYVTADSELASYHTGHFSANGTAPRSMARPFLVSDENPMALGPPGGGGGAELYFGGGPPNGNGSAHLAGGSRTVDPRRAGGGLDAERAYYSLSRTAGQQQQQQRFVPNADDYEFDRGGDLFMRGGGGPPRPPQRPGGGGAAFGPPGYATLDERQLRGALHYEQAMRRSCDELNSVGGTVPLHDYSRPLYSVGRSEHGSLASLDRLGGGGGPAAAAGGYPTMGRGGGGGPPAAEVVALLRAGVPAGVRANAAAYLQHACYENERAKAAVREAHGVGALVTLLDDEDDEVQRSACGALRNISYGRDVQNKLAVRECDGIPALIGLLQRTRHASTVDVVTGTLWNLSSHEPLKKVLVELGLPVLVERVLEPESGWAGAGGPGAVVSSSSSSTSSSSSSNAFRNTTGCLRNVSSAGVDVRLRMRQCPGLVDSLLHFLRTAVADHNTDTKAVENSVCVLRNLSCDIFRDVPDGGAAGAAGSLGSPRKRATEARCFSKREKGSKGGDVDEVDNPPRSEPPPRGWELLYQPDTVRVYVSLLKQSRNAITLEAVTSAIYTLASGDGTWSEVAREVARKEEGLPRLVDQLRSERERVLCASAHALRALSRNAKNKSLIGNHGIRSLVQRLPEVQESPAGGGAGGGGGNPPGGALPPLGEDGVGAVLAALTELVTGSAENARAVQAAGGIERAVAINASRSSSSREQRSAAALLTALWTHRENHSRYKKDGWSKMHFQGNAGSSAGTVGRGKAGSHDDATLPLMGTAKKADGQPRGSREQLEEIPLEDMAPGRKY